MSIMLQRITHSLIALSWSGMLLYFYCSNRIVKYVAPDFRLMVLCSGLGLAVMGCFILLTAKERKKLISDQNADHFHDHESSDMHPLTSFFLMVIPIVGAICFTKDTYSLSALSHKSVDNSPISKNVFGVIESPPLTREYIEKTHQKTSDGYFQFNLLELYFAVGDKEALKVIEGMKVETEGRLVDEKANNQNGSRKRLYRLFITCCAADAKAVPINLEFGTMSYSIKDNNWVKVAGVIRFLNQNGAFTPVLEVAIAHESDPPWEESFIRKQ
jgi:uncharacterized repeat protein (TIGR03943 family)